jgi:4-alpha-glucanotransferase
MDAIFDAVGKDAVQADPGFQAWLKSSESWVHTYAAFKVQLAREKAFNNKWHDCTQWSKGQSEVQSIVNPAGQDYDQVLRVYFMQYHLHLQLLESSKVTTVRTILLISDHLIRHILARFALVR